MSFYAAEMLFMNNISLKISEKDILQIFLLDLIDRKDLRMSFSDIFKKNIIS
jgi:hypothetical protein